MSVEHHLFDLQIKQNEERLADLLRAVNAACHKKDGIDRFRYSNQQIHMTTEQIEVLAEAIEEAVGRLQALAEKVRTP